jgi:hypothetical protein
MNQLDICVACNQPMLAVEPDQITHPSCDPDDTSLPILSLDEINQLIGDQGRCLDCGDPLNQPGLMQRCRGRHKRDAGMTTATER